MACTIVIQDVRGIESAPPGGGPPEIATLRVVGDAPGCSAVDITSTSLGIAATGVPVTGNQFSVDLPITTSPKPDCGDSYDLRVECADVGEFCEQHGTFLLPCCQIQILSVLGITPGHQLRPATLEISGEAAGCPKASGASSPSVLISATTSTGAVIGTITASVDNFTRRFTANLPITTTTPVVCGETITITASCGAGASCMSSEDYEVDCFDCYRVQASVDLSQPCTTGASPTKPVSLNVIIGLPAGVTSRNFVWDLGGGTLGAPFTATVVSDSDFYRHKETFSLAPGTYTATLRFATGAPENCLEYTITFTVTCTTTTSCPTIDPPVVGPCKANGKRDVQFTVHGVTGQLAVVEWIFPTTNATAATIPAGGPDYMQTFELFPGESATLHTLVPTGCADLQVMDTSVNPPVPWTVPACPTTTPCPTFDPPTVGPCKANGKRDITFVVHAPPGTPATIEWIFSASSGNAVTIPAGANNTQTIEFAPGETATLRTLAPTGCPDQPVMDAAGAAAFTVPACPPTTTPCDLDVTIDPMTGIMIGPCVNGKRTVSVTATTNNDDPADRYLWQWDPANPATNPLTVAQGGKQQSHDYDAPGTGLITVTIFLTVIRRPDCVATETRNVSFDGCGTLCPQITGLSIDAANAPCTSDGNHRNVLLDATVTGSGVVQYVWTVDDGTTPPRTITRPGSLGPDIPVDLAPGSYTVTLTANGPTGCSSQASQMISVPACCPVVTGISDSQIPCQKGTATVSTNLTASFTGAASSFEWNFGDGTPNATTAIPNAPPHDYAPNSYMVTVTARSPGCPDSVASQSITVRPCGEPTRTEIDACTALLWASVIISILGFLGLVGGCILAQYYPYAGWIVQIIGAALAGLAILLFGLWWLICRFITPCDVINAVFNFIVYLIFVVGIITAIIAAIGALGQVGWLTCLLWTLAAWAWWGTVNLILWEIAKGRGCVIQVSTPGASSSSSSSNPLTSDTQRIERPPHAYSSAADTPTPCGPDDAMRQAVVESPEPDSGADAPAATSIALAEPERAAGLGDVIKRATTAMGIKPCAGCHERAERLNRAFPLNQPEGQQPPEQPA